jgi:hypothetical protein
MEAYAFHAAPPAPAPVPAAPREGRRFGGSASRVPVPNARAILEKQARRSSIIGPTGGAQANRRLSTATFGRAETRANDAQAGRQANLRARRQSDVTWRH